MKNGPEYLADLEFLPKFENSSFQHKLGYESDATEASMATEEVSVVEDKISGFELNEAFRKGLQRFTIDAKHFGNVGRLICVRKRKKVFTNWLSLVVKYLILVGFFLNSTPASRTCLHNVYLWTLTISGFHNSHYLPVDLSKRDLSFVWIMRMRLKVFQGKIFRVIVEPRIAEKDCYSNISNYYINVYYHFFSNIMLLAWMGIFAV